MEEHNKNINRRDFLKIVGISAATTTAAATLYSCKQKDGVIPGGSASTPVPTDKMTYRTSVAQKDRVSLLGYGCMRWPTVPSPDGKGDMIDQDAVNELVDYAIAHGLNYFDTSPVYVQGWSEKSTGIALKRHPREKLFIATKLSNFSNYSRENSIAMYRKSFEDLQTDYIDYYLLHSIGNGGIEDELVKRNIPAIIMEPLLGGRLSNVPTHIMTRLKQRRPEDSVASWAFRFAGSPELVLTVLSGMTYMEHLQDNIRTYSPLIPLTDDDKEFLEETAQLMLKYPTVPCNDCKYCMPCPYGIDIPAVLIHYNKCVNEGNVPKSQQDENYRKARQAFLVGYDRSVPRLRQANHCIGCDQCSPHCPQSINIPKELRRIDGFVEQLKQGTL